TRAAPGASLGTGPPPRRAGPRRQPASLSNVQEDLMTDASDVLVHSPVGAIALSPGGYVSRPHASSHGPRNAPSLTSTRIRESACAMLRGEADQGKRPPSSRKVQPAA